MPSPIVGEGIEVPALSPHLGDESYFVAVVGVVIQGEVHTEVIRVVNCIRDVVGEVFAGLDFPLGPSEDVMFKVDDQLSLFST